MKLSVFDAQSSSRLEEFACSGVLPDHAPLWIDLNAAEVGVFDGGACVLDQRAPGFEASSRPECTLDMRFEDRKHIAPMPPTCIRREVW